MLIVSSIIIIIIFKSKVPGVKKHSSSPSCCRMVLCPPTPPPPPRHIWPQNQLFHISSGVRGGLLLHSLLVAGMAVGSNGQAPAFRFYTWPHLTSHDFPAALSVFLLGKV